MNVTDIGAKSRPMLTKTGRRGSAKYVPDALDSKLAQALMRDPLQSIQRLAAEADVVTRTASQRLARLTSLGLLKVVARKDIKLFGLEHSVLTEFSHSSPELIEAIKRDPNVSVSFQCLAAEKLYVIRGYDQISGVHRDMDQFLQFAPENTNCRHELLLDVYKNGFSYDDMGHSARSESGHGGRHETIVGEGFDEIDNQIVRFLSEDARQSMRGIARNIGISEKGVRLRVQALKQKKLIAIGAVVNQNLLRESRVAMTRINIAPQHRADLLEKIRGDKRVQFVASMIGEHELYMASLFGSVESLERFQQELLPMCTNASTTLITRVISSRFDMVSVDQVWSA